MIRKAQPGEHAILTSISFRSKSYWKYPERYLQIWRDELTITREYLENHLVYVYEEKGKVVAYYSLVELLYDQHFPCVTLRQGVWLDHMFVLPENMGQGIGRELFEHCLEFLLEYGAESLLVLADPNASGFYEKMGCAYIEEYPSTIEGRTTPYLEYRLKVLQEVEL